MTTVYVLRSFWHEEGEAHEDVLGVFTKFEKVMDVATTDEAQHSKTKLNAPQYGAAEFTLDGGFITSFTRYASGQWASRCIVCSGSARVSDNVCSGCGGEGFVKLASPEAKAAYLSASADFQVPR